MAEMITYLVQGEKGVYLHDREVVPKEDERWHIYDVLRTTPKMRGKLQGACDQEPDKVTGNDVPRREVETALEDRYGALVRDIYDEYRTCEEGERIEELINLQTGELTHEEQESENGHLPSCTRHMGALSRYVAP